MTDRHRRYALLKAMRNVVPLRPPLDCLKLAEQLREIIFGNASDAERVAFERELRGLRASQRAMIAARAANCERSDGYQLREHLHHGTCEGINVMKITARQAAEVAQVSVSLVSNARVVLRRATAAEIRTIEQGEVGAGAGIGVIASQLRQKLTAPQRKRLAAVPPNERGDAPARIQQQWLKAMVWRQLRDGLKALAELPRIDDVVEIARSHDQTGLVDRKLLRAHERLGELIEAWTRPSERAVFPLARGEKAKEVRH